MLDQRLRSLLVCPEDRGPLLLIANERSREEHGLDERSREELGVGEFLYNSRLRRAYRIEAGVPVLLVTEAVTITDDAEHQAFVARAEP